MKVDCSNSFWKFMAKTFSFLFTCSSTNPNPNPNPNPEANMTKKAVCVGINKYKTGGNRLNGCVNDAMEWKNVLTTKFGFQSVNLMVDEAATKANILSAIKNLITGSKSGDVLAITYSGHGTSVADQSGDEADGRDECWVSVEENLIADDEFRAIFNLLPSGAKLTIISDSCFSGSITRACVASWLGKDIKTRYMAPPKGSGLEISKLPVKSRIAFPESGMNHMLVSGCKDTEYSYDAYFDKAMGAMSYYATNILKSNPSLTYAQFYTELQNKLPNGAYPQSPQLEGSDANRNSAMFN